MYSENYAELKDFLKLTNNSLKFNRKNNFLPFNTQRIGRVSFQNGLLPIIGGLSRLVCGKNIDLTNRDVMLNDIFNNEFFEVNEKNKFYFKGLVNDYLGVENFNILHPKLFLFLPLSDGKESTGEKKISKFLSEIFFKNVNLEYFFNGENSNFSSNILIEFIISNLNDLPNKSESDFYQYPKSLNKVLEVIEEDFNFLLNHEDFLLNNFDLIVAYYLYFYFIQFTLKSFYTLDENNYVSGDIEHTYFLLDWETVSVNRLSITSGYKRVNDFLKELMIKIDLSEHLNILFGTENLILPEFLEYFDNLNDGEQIEFLKYFKYLIRDVRVAEGLDEIILPDTFIKLINVYYQTLEESNSISTRAGPLSRYPKTIENLGKKYFLKRRGRYGYMFNIDQEMLMIITSLCIKDEKIKLTDLYSEYERRGLFFDQESINRINELLNNLNYIDKKSDSGGIQYVKSIL
ncbi:DNA phosphorothioation-dependent restriction protein DptG [Methanobrevibacter sp.]|uniref:DNA phosphorothioation-dependent restriction protein DptG n=1 Tax=Methanobrevibacter sp. TaxID=66852 RepID=UPI002E790512|nr:DNA phosphorothioation-dependent restriction protein DptG [Methanobrevibacter sp.]MEE0024229.1 DNA phosphorothioation-dependent restriction protein DptG [Methanobrevibacter sp.]